MTKENYISALYVHLKNGDIDQKQHDRAVQTLNETDYVRGLTVTIEDNDIINFRWCGVNSKYFELHLYPNFNFYVGVVIGAGKDDCCESRTIRIVDVDRACEELNNFKYNNDKESLVEKLKSIKYVNEEELIRNKMQDSKIASLEDEDFFTAFDALENNTLYGFDAKAELERRMREEAKPVFVKLDRDILRGFRDLGESKADVISTNDKKDAEACQKTKDIIEEYKRFRDNQKEIKDKRKEELETKHEDIYKYFERRFAFSNNTPEYTTEEGKPNPNGRIYSVECVNKGIKELSFILTIKDILDGGTHVDKLINLFDLMLLGELNNTDVVCENKYTSYKSFSENIYPVLVSGDDVEGRLYGMFKEGDFNYNTLYSPDKHPKMTDDKDNVCSVDVNVVDEDGLLGVAYYHYVDEEWYFHTDTLVDYSEEGNETKWNWHYPLTRVI